MRKTLAAIAAVAALLATACGHPASTTAAPTAPSSSSTASPVTAAGALAAADTYFGFYGAGQYAAAYPLLAPASRAAVSEHVYVAAHQQCRRASAGLSYKVSHPIVSGTTAVVTVSLAGAAASLGSEQASFTYSGGRWLYDIPDLAVYRHHTVRQALAALTAQGDCSG